MTTSDGLPAEFLGAARYAVAALVHERKLANRNVPREVAKLYQYLMSEPGHERDETPSSERELNGSDDLIGVPEAAVILGCTERHVTRIAGELDGTRPAGRRTWLFPRGRVVAIAQRNRKARSA